MRRNLLILAGVLLVVGAIAAMLTPRDLREPITTSRGRTGATTTTTPGTATAAPQATSGTASGTVELTRTIDASSPRTAVVRAQTGDLMHLVVKAAAVDNVEIQGLGQFAAVDPDAPARFDFFLETAGSFPVRLQESNRVIGRVVVAARPL